MLVVPKYGREIIEYMQALNDRIWFTYKARIKATERLSNNDSHSQAILVWYALISSALSVIVIRYPKLLGEDTDLVSAILGVALVVISLFVTGRDFRGRAMKMRSNYIALQDLYLKASQSSSVSQADIDRYTELLEGAENHLEIDDKMFRVFEAGKLTRPVTFRETVQVYVSMASRNLMIIILYFSPLGILMYLSKM
jgi:hypothetical protein